MCDPLRWQFACEGSDIGFGVFRKSKKGEWKKASEMEEVVPSQRYNAHLVPEDGSLTCERPGVCELSLPVHLKPLRHLKSSLFENASLTVEHRCAEIRQHVQHLPGQTGQLHRRGSASRPVTVPTGGPDQRDRREVRQPR